MGPLRGCIAAVLFAVCAVPQLVSPSANHDVAWYLHAARRFTDGDRLYVDLVDVNPPLIVYLSAIPTAVARSLGVSEILAFHAFVVLLAAASLATIQRTLRRIDWPTPGTRLLWTWALSYILLVAPAGDFGQREHLVLILFLPYAVATGVQWSGARLPWGRAITIGLLAGIGIALKPPFVLVPLLIAVAQRRRGQGIITPENIGLLSALAVYAAHFALWPADMLAGLRHTMALAWDTYGGLDQPLQFAFQPAFAECLVYGGALLFLPATGPARCLGTALALGGVGFLAAALLQQKGWSYHFLPAASCGAVLLTVAALPRLDHRWLRWTMAGVLLALTITALVELDPERHGVRWARPHGSGDAELLRELAGGGAVVALDTSVGPHFPAVLVAGLPWASRFACLWPVPRLVETTMQDHERSLRNAIVDDFLRYAPRVVVVPLSPVLFVADSEFDMLPWLSRDSRFAEIFARYELVHRANRYDYYRLRP